MINKVLVIAPKKVAEATWQKEAAKWDHLGLLRFSTVLGDVRKRTRALNMPADIYVISRDSIDWLVDYYGRDWPFDMVVADEFSSFKSPTSKRFKALKRIRPRIQRFVGLTGTPAPNGLLDLWAQVYLLDSGLRLGVRREGFRERFFQPDKRDRHTIWSYKPKDGADSHIKRMIGDICISMSAQDYLQLPPLMVNTIPVKLDSAAQKAYDELERDMLLEVDEATIDAGSAAVLTNKLLQLCNGAVYDADRNVIGLHNNKITAFTELIEGLTGQHALVFYNFQHDKIRLQKALSKMSLRVRELKNPQDESDWNNGQIDVLLAHPASAAYGLNLQQGGRHVIWFGLNWSLELYQQANKRLHRQGQTDTVFVHHLAVLGGTDEDVVKALESKSDTQDQLLDALKARIDKAKMARE